MSSFRHDEFSIVITWKEPHKGSYPRVPVAGFYLTMGWANEGTADWIARDRLLTNEQLATAVEVLGERVVILDDQRRTRHWYSLGQNLKKEANTKHDEVVKRLTEQRDKLNAQLEKLS